MSAGKEGTEEKEGRIGVSVTCEMEGKERKKVRGEMRIVEITSVKEVR